MDNLKPLFVTSLLGMLLVLAGGCGGGVEDDTQEAPIGNIAGTWTISETADSSDPTCSGNTSYDLVVAQSGNNLTVTDPNGNVFTGTISGNSGSWTGSYPDDGGTTTINSLTATIASDCRSMSGNSKWSWTDGNSSCSGTTRFNGVRQGSNSC